MAYRRTRRRKARLTWLPTHGTDVPAVGSQVAYVASPSTFQLSAAQNVTIAHAIYPMVLPDFPIEEDYSGQTMADVIGGEYRIRRIVGNFFAHTYADTAADTTPGAALLTLGIFIARADGNDPTQPINGGAAAASVDVSSRSYNPQDLATIREPWMFRRSWALGTYAGPFSNHSSAYLQTQSQFQSWASSYPKSTAGYTGIRSGPFIDVKTMRRIKNDERLWFVVQYQPLPFLANQGANTLMRCEGVFDYRILGNLLRARQGGAF